MTFPQTILDTRVELLLGSTWTNITDHVYERDPVTITRGHPDETTAANPTVCALTLNNRDGRFSPRNPVGAYYGNLTRNTQMRVSVPEGASYLRSETDTTSGATTPTSSALNIAGDIDIRIEVTLDNWYAKQVLAAKYDLLSNNIGWAFLVRDDSTLTLAWSNDGSTSHNAISTVGVGMPALRHLALRATLAVSTGTVTFYTAPTISGSWTQLGSTVVLGATSIFASNQPLVVGYNSSLASSGISYVGYQGKIHQFQLLSGIGGTTKASPNFATQAAGATSFADAQGNTWTLTGTAEVSDRKYRAHVEVPEWPPRWDNTGNDVYAPLQGSGRLRRLTAGTPPANSALYRAFVRAAGTDFFGNSLVPLAYWPCEDGSNSTQIAAAIGSTPMSFAGPVSFGAFSGFVASQPVITLSGARISGVPPAASSTPTVNCLKFLMAVPSGGGVNNNVIARIYTTGSVARLDLIYTTGGNLTLTGYNASGAQIGTSGAVAAGVDGALLMMSMQLVKDGTGVDCGATFLNFALPNSVVAGPGFTVASSSVGQVTQVAFNPAAAVDSTAIGHIAVGVANDVTDYGNALQAWTGEAAGSRFARLCTEEGIASRITGSLTDTVLMGYQTAQTVQALLQEIEDADKGLIYEPRQVFGLAYRTRVSMFNQSAAVALSYTGAQLSLPVEPTDDDQLIVNDVTITRSSAGSSNRQTLTTGALSTQNPPNGVGLYGNGFTVNLSADSQLADETGWWLLLGTVDDVRYPTLSVDLARSELASVYYQAQDADIGDRLTVASTPVWLPPDGISQIIRGQTEVCYGYVFTEQWVCVPEAPYRVAVFDDPVLGRGDTDGSTVHANISSGATSMQVDTTGAATGSPLWTRSAADFPFDLEVGGERMTVTSVSTQIGAADGTFESGVGGWSAFNGAIASSSAQAYQGTKSALLTPTGGFSNAYIQSDYLACAVGQQWALAAYCYSPGGWSAVFPNINWYDSGKVFLSSGSSSVSVPAAAWTALAATYTAPASAAFLTVDIGEAGSPGAGNTIYFDWVTVQQVTGPQTFSVTRSVNGVVKAQSAGTDVRLFQPSIMTM